jgi:putative molybdopterin biosynthesis protein
MVVQSVSPSAALVSGTALRVNAPERYDNAACASNKGSARQVFARFGMRSSREYGQLCNGEGTILSVAGSGFGAGIIIKIDGVRTIQRPAASSKAMQLLTTIEAAEYLRIKERKLYELVAENAIPCTKITGKWLFPKDELDNWLRISLVQPNGSRLADPLPIVGGSHDPLLDWALRESGSGLACLQEGSEAGLERFTEGKITAAAIHLHAQTKSAKDANVAAVRTRYGFFDAALIAFAEREQGILTASGNPLDIGGIDDLVRKKPKVLMRQAGAGAQQLLTSLLGREGLSLKQIKTVSPPCTTGSDIAQAIRAGRGDCGIATRAIASASGLDFLPLVWERFDIVVRQSEYFKPPFQKLLIFLNSELFRARAGELGGYDIADVGKVRTSP